MLLPAALCACLAAGDAPAAPFGALRDARRSVVKIHVTIQPDDFTMPWQGGRPGRGSGSGFVISKRRILTNAHVVSNVRFLEVQKNNDPKRYPATVAYIGHDCDLAVLSVADPSFYADTRPLELADALPQLSDEVTAIGYPLGGDRISLTRGVVSRIDYNAYSHSGVDHHLVLQVDAAINPGNSGGPVLYRGRVVGLAFQGLVGAENIGYAIPVPVIRHFLDDIADGAYNEYPELGVAFLQARNAALRSDLALPADKTGVVVYYIDPFGSGRDRLRERDVLLSVDGHDIQNDGSVLLDGTSVSFTELLERKQWGETVRFEVWRDGAQSAVTVPLNNPRDPFAFRQLYDRRPEYLMLGGLVFSPLTRNYAQTMGFSDDDSNNSQLVYALRYAKSDNLYTNREQFVVLIRRLAHPANTYADTFLNGIVSEANGRPVGSLRELKEALARPEGGFHVIRFSGLDDMLVLDRKAADRAGAEIQARYGVTETEHFEEAE
jgi:S1-C subfamily serine protease